MESTTAATAAQETAEAKCKKYACKLQDCLSKHQVHTSMGTFY